MTGHKLEKLRREKGLTQVVAAQRLGVSQTYLSLLESGRRPFTEKIAKKAAKLYDLPTAVPTRLAAGEVPAVSDADLAADLADLGYLGFSHLRRKRPRRKNPADVLLSALNAPQREARAIEALPWLVLAFPDMNWSDVTRAAKMYDLQNRLGFVVNVARGVAELQGRDSLTVNTLKEREAELERSMLAREDTLCNKGMTNAERRWLASNRSDSARHWRLLTSLSPKLVRYAG
jgi:transcriptional regulator with XRE-family HTH domain